MFCFTRLVMGTPRSAPSRSSWLPCRVALLLSGVVALLGPVASRTAPPAVCLEACDSCLHPNQPEPLCWMNCLDACGRLESTLGDTASLVLLAGDGAAPVAGDEPAEKRVQESPDAYRIQHFRWGQPLPGKKRQPEQNPGAPLGMDSGDNEQVVVVAADGSHEGWPGEMGNEAADERPWSPALSKKGSGPLSIQKENPELYQMSHFRWGQPPTHFKQKRYGGFMRKSPGYAHLKPLVTFFRDVMKNDGPAGVKN